MGDYMDYLELELVQACRSLGDGRVRVERKPFNGPVAA
jgi:hypothetical protein